MGLGGVAMAQSTTGSLFGEAPAAAGGTVLIQNASGFNREVPVDASGRYNAGSLPVGVYTVTLRRDGQTIDSRSNVTLRAGSGTDVSFASAENAQNLGAISVTASALPSIDVSSVDSRTVITAQQLAKLPLARTAEAVALLAPGAIEGSGYFVGPNGNRLVSFGGSSVTENAYYINGFNTTDPLSGFGGITLPYGAIDQEEILTGGYDAQFGRSDGGVISMIGKRGTNEWHFGAQMQWTPASTRSAPMDFYYPNNGNPRGGQIYRRRSGSNEWTALVDAYVGGPLIKDKLYFFAATEAARREGNDIGTISAPYNTQYRYTDPKTYVKLDWNINDNNVLELTHVRS
jgi:outer membrane receptor for ferrienterochelin and colicin